MCKISASEINILTVEEKIQIYYRIGLLYYDLSVHKKSIINLEEYLKNQRDENLSNRITCMKYLALGYAHLSDLSKSKEIYDEFKLEFSERERIEIKAVFHYMSGNYLKSRTMFTKLLKNWKYYSNFIDRCLFYACVDYQIARLKLIMLEYTVKVFYNRSGKNLKRFKEKYLISTVIMNKNHPIFAEFHNHIAYSLELLGKYDEALKYLERAKWILKNNYQQESLVYIQSLVQSASLYLQKNDIPKARERLESIKNIQDGYRGYIIDLKEIYILEGRIYLQENLIDEARSLFWKITEIETKRNGFYSFHVAFCYQLIAETYIKDLIYLRKYFKISRRILVFLCGQHHPEVFRNSCLYLESLTKAGAKEKGFRLATRSKEQLQTLVSRDDLPAIDFLKSCYAKIRQLLET